MKKIIKQIFTRIILPLTGIAVCLFIAVIVDIFDMKIEIGGPFHQALIGFGSSSGILTLIGCASFIKWIVQTHQTNGRLKTFKTNADGSYTCPICRMVNVNILPCERCGFDPTNALDIKEELPRVVESQKTKEKLAPKQKTLFCNKCGTQLLLDSLFCNRCGAKVNCIINKN